MFIRVCIFALALAGIPFSSPGQESLSIDTTLLSDYNITQMDFSSTQGAVITDQNDVFLIRENNEVVNLTDAFEDHRGSAYTAIGFIHEDLFLIGTAGDSLLVYDNGSVRQIGGQKGLDADHVTSILANKYGATVGTTTGLYSLKPPFEEASDYYRYSDFKDSVLLMPRNRATFMYSLGGDPYCGNIDGSRMINLAPTVTYERGFHTLAEHVNDEKIKTALLLPVYGVWNIIFDYSHMLQGSNLGLRFYSLSSCYPNIQTLIDGISINDIQMMALDNTMNIPNFIFVGTDEGLYYIPDASQTNDLEVLKIDTLGNTVINKVSFKDISCDESVWLATESGLMQLKVHGMDPKYTRDIQLQEYSWCEGDTVGLSPMRTINFDFQWIRNGEILEGETNYYYRAGNHGFYQLAVSNCHFTDTVDVADFTYNDDVDATVNYSGSLEICDNDYVLLYGPYLQNRDQTFQWYFDGDAIEGETNRSVEITQSGVYQLQAFNCNMESAWSDTFDFTIHPTETPELQDNSSDDYICVGDTIWLKEPTMDVSIQWESYYTDEYDKFNDLPYVIMQDDRPSKVTFTTEEGCSQYLNLPYWYVSPKAHFQFYADTIEFCEGNSASPNYSSNAWVYWTDGEEGNRQIDEPGVYYAYSMDSYSGCPSELDTLVVQEIDVPEFQLPADTSIYLGDSLIIEGPPGYDNYNWSGGFTTRDFYFKPAISGIFRIILRINSTQMCYGEDEMVIEVRKVPEPLGSDGSQTIRVYPNPVASHVSIQGIKVHSVDLYDLSGRRVLSKIGNDENIRLGHLTKGTYILLINGMHSFKIQKN